jgi:hypothetical protein
VIELDGEVVARSVSERQMNIYQEHASQQGNATMP